MSNETLHPDVAAFKTFIQEHPDLIKEVRSGRADWNQLYQDWYILGEEDEIWAPYRSESNTPAQSSQAESLTQLLSQINVQELQKHMSQFSGVLGNVQQLMKQFQGPQEQQMPEPPSHDPFSFRGF
ncbi:putative coat protein YlbD-like [Salsuginibacillus halophilus]|uniref:Putative coat protein YlbD-like n=1 Tax=Salsuginibacillus halophilus TaxID=517424 RepID=A0A2P8HX59_9BACI|nr:YlbD family protein [Salsuginibacillus halophilus]PSL50816.1 putative coat protein YlbD-like [Salsuginibacillus halophilus]